MRVRKSTVFQKSSIKLFGNNLNLLQIFCTILLILEEDYDEHDGYDAAYGDEGLGTVPHTVGTEQPSSIETITVVENTYYESTNESYR